MALVNDSLETVRQRMASDYELQYQQAGITVDAHTRGTGHTEKVNALSAVAYGLRLNQQYIAEQLFISSMNEENLLKLGAELGVLRIAPSFATGAMNCTGIDGSVIPESTVVKHANGMQYRVLNETVISGVTLVNLIAIETGVKGNLYSAETLTFSNSIEGVDSEATVAGGGLTTGSDIESIDRFRERVDARRKQPPMGGKDYDYQAWAKAASVDVTTAWVSPHEVEVGQIILRFVTEDLATPIPSAALINIVNDYVAEQKPVEARLIVQAPTLHEIDLTFTNLVPNTVTVQDAVTAELEDLLDQSARTDSTLYINKIRAAISNAPGVDDFTLSLNSNIDITIDEYAVLGTVLFP